MGFTFAQDTFKNTIFTSGQNNTVTEMEEHFRETTKTSIFAIDKETLAVTRPLKEVDFYLLKRARKIALDRVTKKGRQLLGGPG